MARDKRIFRKDTIRYRITKRIELELGRGEVPRDPGEHEAQTAARCGELALETSQLRSDEFPVVVELFGHGRISVVSYNLHNVPETGIVATTRR